MSEQAEQPKQAKRARQSEQPARAEIGLLAARLRVEERQLIAAFASPQGQDKEYQATLVTPDSLRLSLRPSEPLPWQLVIQRGVITRELATLAALLNGSGVPTINRAATARLLSDRLALLRHLVFYGVSVPETIAAFGEQATLEAIAALGYPVLLQSFTVDPGFPSAVVTDLDAAEAIVEHRITLGGENAVLVQKLNPAVTRSLRLSIVGAQLIGIEQRTSLEAGASYTDFEGDPAPYEQLAANLTARLGTGTYAIEVDDAPEGLVVTGAGNLVDFRGLAAAGIDVAGAIAGFAREQLAAQPAQPAGDLALAVGASHDEH